MGKTAHIYVTIVNPISKEERLSFKEIWFPFCR